jgi:hypothetical protein
MADQESFSCKQFGAAFKTFLDQVAAQAPVEESAISRRLKVHLAASLDDACVVSQTFEIAEQANIQVAVDTCVASQGRSAELLGIAHDFAHVLF